MQGNSMDAVSDFCIRIRNVLRMESAVYRLPCLAGVIRTENTCSGNGAVNALVVGGIDQDRMQSHSSRTRHPLFTSWMAAQSGEFLPGFAAIGCAKNRSILHSRINSIGIG